MIVEAVALHRFPARGAYRMAQRFDSLLFRSCDTRHVENFFPHDRAMQIIHAVGKGDLGKRQSHAHPIGGEMLNVIEIDAADREVAELFESGCPWDVGEGRALWLEGERNKAGETSRLILELAQLSQVVDPLFIRLDV